MPIHISCCSCRIHKILQCIASEADFTIEMIGNGTRKDAEVCCYRRSAMKHAVLVLIAVCAASGAAQAQSKKKEWTPGQGIDWKNDWDAAVEEAAARNVPIHIAIHKDN